ncbi:MAG: peptidylprolyl isomerase [Luteolibacter sp.]|uniref:peptidylprolyl isomerase n=1 Tax=Luteolibacter sp. TaxID=1962973 RepID=UPI003263EA12
MKNLPRILCLAAAFYLLGDAFLVKGPVSRWLHSALNPKTEPLAARVSTQLISSRQLDRAVIERLWLEGKSAAALPPTDLKAARDAALNDLIDESLLDLQTKALTPQLVVNPQEINGRIVRLSARFENKAAFDAAMKSQGIATEQDLRDRLAAMIRREKYIELRITPAIKISDDEARKWFEDNKQAIALPERIEARQVFIATLDHPPEEAKQKLDAALLELTEKKKDFPILAKELSEDSATKDSGGNLGWMTRDRLPADFATPVFAMELNRPALVRTKLGWHLVEVTAHKLAEARTFEQAKSEILAALETIKRHDATEDLRKSLRNAAVGKIEIFPALAAIADRPSP